MSLVGDNLGTFNPNQYINNGQGSKSKQRMAGDYIKDFTQNGGNTMSYTGKNGKNYSTNTEKMLFGNSSNSSSSNNKSTPTNNSNGSSSQLSASNSNINYGIYDPKLGGNKNIDANYAANQQIINSYNGKNAKNSTANGAAYNADVMSGIRYDMAVRKNKKYDSIKATQASIAAGNDHGIHKHKAPQSKEYYDYLKSYDGPKSYEDVVAANDSTAVQMGLDKSKPRAYDTWNKYNKDKEDYEAAWGSGESVASQRGWNDTHLN